MTASLLLAYILTVLLFEVAVLIAAAAWRTRRANRVALIDVSGPAVSPGAWPGWRPFRVARRDFEDADRTQCSFHLVPVDRAELPPFKPGQFLTFALPAADNTTSAADEQHRIIRCYSLSDRPEPASYRVTIKRVMPPADRPHVPPGAASAYFHDRVKVGDILEIKSPSGQFYIDPDPQIPSVLICGGIGITPMMSMVRWCLDQQPERVIHMFYGLRHGGEHAFKQTLEALAQAHPNFHLHVLYSKPRAEDVHGEDFEAAGHVDGALLRRVLPHGRHKFYVCGPPPMMESLVPGLREWGVLEEDIHHEAFGPASLRSAVGRSPDGSLRQLASIEVTFRRSGRTLTWDGRDTNLLDFAERHGIGVESGCRSGSCGSCETRLLSGTVRYPEKPDHDITPGKCLLCVGVPESALSLEA